MTEATLPREAGELWIEVNKLTKLNNEHNLNVNQTMFTLISLQVLRWSLGEFSSSPSSLLEFSIKAQQYGS